MSVSGQNCDLFYLFVRLKMNELNINDLPRETIIKVLRYLDGKNLKNATLTCKLWKNLIEAACRWSVSVTTNKQKMDFILTTDRKFGSIKITGGHLNLTEDNQILTMFRRHGFYLVKLDMRSQDIQNLTTFAEMLRLTPNLKRLDMAFMKLHSASDAPLDQVLPDLKKLKKLLVNECDPRIIKCFRKAKLSEIKIWEDESLQHCDSYKDFLLTQDMLTSLTADSDNSSPSIPVAMGKLNVPIPFRLTQLAISYVDDQQSSHDNLLRFVKSQAEHLNHLELEGLFPHSVYECIFASMTQLKTLSVVVDDIPLGNDFYERLKENTSVRTIKLLDMDMDMDNPFLPNFLKKLPNIHSLILPNEFVGNSTLTMAQTAGKVESLSVYEINQYLIESVKFPNLHTLQIGELCSKVNWNEFTKIQCRLAELTIERIVEEEFLTSDDIDQITTNVDLQTIRLGLGFNADDRFFEIIRTKCVNLKVLDLHERCISDELNTNVGINVLRFCNDFSLNSKLFLNLGDEVH